MIRSLTSRIWMNFAKWSKPKPKVEKLKEERKSFSIGDEKAAKLSKSEQEQENKLKMLQIQKIQAETKRQTGIYRSHHKSLQQHMSRQQLQTIRIKQYFHLKEPIYGNYTDIYNRKYKSGFKEINGDLGLRRMGTLGVKLGMTMLWDRWGHLVPVTVVQLDRVQVVQVKKPVQGNQFYQVQMGIGEANIKRVPKSLLGHFIKSGVPPKKAVAEFKVSEECLLPVGYMMTPRHYTPGMFVDVVSRTVGHGFQGTIKKYGFRRQPETHGNSTTTRVLGSTGCRQDPGRVFKLKKMYGHMGNKMTVQSGLTVFKIDVDKNLLYLKGSVPGKAGTIVKIRDTLNLDKLEKNLELVHYPTFVEEKGVKYARQMSMYCGERDPEELEIHDNAFMIDDGEEDTEKAAPTTAADKDDLGE